MTRFRLLAASLMLAAPIALLPASATAQRHHDHGRRHVDRDHGHRRVDRHIDHSGHPYHSAYRGHGYHRWARGQRFDRRYASHYTVINNWRAYRGRRLYAPPRGYHWVRSGNDAVLVAVAGGLIGAVLSGAFN